VVEAGEAVGTRTAGRHVRVARQEGPLAALRRRRGARSVGVRRDKAEHGVALAVEPHLAHDHVGRVGRAARRRDRDRAVRHRLLEGLGRVGHAQRDRARGEAVRAHVVVHLRRRERHARVGGVELGAPAGGRGEDEADRAGREHVRREARGARRQVGARDELEAERVRPARRGRLRVGADELDVVKGVDLEAVGARV
jgi:hypothetical protein